MLRIPDSDIIYREKRLGGRQKVYSNIEELASKAPVRRWIEGYKEGHSRRHAKYAINRYVNWRKAKGLDCDPEAWVEQLEDATRKAFSKHLMALLDYVKSDEFEGDKNETRRKQYFRIRGFYESNMVPLPPHKLKLPQQATNHMQIQTTATSFLEMARKVLSNGKLSPRDRSIIMTMLQSGMDDSTVSGVFNHYAYPQLVSHFGTSDYEKWDVSSCPVKIDILRPKSAVRYYTFIDVDSVNCLKDWLTVRTANYGPIKLLPQFSPSELPKSDPIYLNTWGRPITPESICNIFRESGKKAGVNVSTMDEHPDFRGARMRYAWHSHEVRDTIRTLARGRADSAAAEFFIGHPIDKLGYDKSPWNDPDYFRGEYLKLARPHLNPISGREIEVRKAVELGIYERDKRMQDTIDELKRQVDRLLSQS